MREGQERSISRHRSSRVGRHTPVQSTCRHYSLVTSAGVDSTLCTASLCMYIQTRGHVCMHSCMHSWYLCDWVQWRYWSTFVCAWVCPIFIPTPAKSIYALLYTYMAYTCIYTIYIYIYILYSYSITCMYVCMYVCTHGFDQSRSLQCILLVNTGLLMYQDSKHELFASRRNTKSNNCAVTVFLKCSCDARMYGLAVPAI